MTDDRPFLTERPTLRLAHDEFARTLSALTSSEYQLLSRCPPWTVGDLVDHLVGGAVMATALLGGNVAADSLVIRDAWVRGPLTTPRRHIALALALERAAFDVVDPNERVDHPVLPMLTADLLVQRIVEYAVHTSDIRNAIDDPTPLDAALARRAWELAAPLAPIAAELTVFGAGPSGLVPADADHEARLVDLTGRRVEASHTDRIGTVAS